MGPVIAPFKRKDPPATGEVAGEPDRKHRRVEPRVRQLYAIDVKPRAQVLAQMRRLFAFEPEYRTVRNLFPDRFDETWMGMARPEGAESHRTVEIGIAVDVPDVNAGGPPDGPRVRGDGPGGAG